MPLHPCNACFSLAMVYTHTMLVLHWSWLISMHCLFSSNHFVDFIYGQMYLSTTFAWFNAGQGNILQHDLINKINLNRPLEQISKPHILIVTRLYGGTRKPIKKAKTITSAF